MEISSEVIVAFITGVVGPTSIMFLKHYLSSRKKKPDLVHETLKVSELVNTKIEHIKEEFNADRVWVTQFHNGGNFYPTGKSMAKFSVIYETVHPGVASIQSNFHNIPVNLFSKSINEIKCNAFIENTLSYSSLCACENSLSKDPSSSAYGLFGIGSIP